MDIFFPGQKQLEWTARVEQPSWRRTTPSCAVSILWEHDDDNDDNDDDDDDDNDDNDDDCNARWYQQPVHVQGGEGEGGGGGGEGEEGRASKSYTGFVNHILSPNLIIYNRKFCYHHHILSK